MEGKGRGFFADFKRPKVNAIRQFPEGFGHEVATDSATRFRVATCANNSSIPVLRSLENLPNMYPPKILEPYNSCFSRVNVVGEVIKPSNSNATIRVRTVESAGKENNPKKIKSCHLNRMNKEAANSEILKYSNSGRTCTNFDARREKVIRVLKMYEELTSYLIVLRKEELKSRKQVGMTRIYIEASMILKKQNKWINTSKQIGSIHGVKTGDKFHSRAELNVIGVHQQFQAGIDYMNKDGKLIATSIVASGRYFEDPGSSDTLIYSGHGGNPTVGSVEVRDQRLEKGNLALKNSKEAKSVVRVIKGVQVLRSSGGEKVEESKCNFKYIYDGLYFVDSCRIERGKFGKLVFKFLLKRVSEQPKLTW